MLILGVSAGFHDSAAAVVGDGQLISAVEQERLTRKKHDDSFPDRAIDVALAVAGVTAADVDLVVHHEHPVTVLDRYLSTRLRTGLRSPRSLFIDLPVVTRTQLGVGHRISRWFADRGCRTPQLMYSDHHSSHAAAAFYPSPFDEAAILTLDGVGEWASMTRGRGIGGRLEVEEQIDFPDSLGLLYSAFTEYCGFRPNGGEGELMGLAPFGSPVYADAIFDHLIDLGEDGSFRLDQRYFSYLRGRQMTSPQFHKLFGGEPRPNGSEPQSREADLAASIQVVLEEVIVRSATDLRRRSGQSALCLGGGVALNCVANGRLLAEGIFDDVWVQPASGDAGAAVGAALWAHHEVLGGSRQANPNDSMSGAFLGPSFSSDEVRNWLDSIAVPYRHVPNSKERLGEVAQRIDAGEVVGWFCGRMEFGPRALGHRSILADPRSPSVQSRLNGLVKERAAFRPFAPAVLAEHSAAWFEHAGELPYMTFTSQLRGEHWLEPAPATETQSLVQQVQEVRSSVPAVTHVNHSARVQTVDHSRNPEFAALLETYFELTGCPVVLNTSFNARDEPIVCTPADALATFRRIGLDLLVLEDCLVESAS